MLTTDYSVVGPWISHRVHCSLPHDGRVIGWRTPDGITAGILYESFTKVAITTTIAIEPGVMVPRRFLWAMCDYPFNQLMVKKVFALVAESNKAALEFDYRTGFKEEARLKNYFEDGDALILSCAKDDCVWLKRLHYGQVQRNC